MGKKAEVWRDGGEKAAPTTGKKLRAPVGLRFRASAVYAKGSFLGHCDAHPSHVPFTYDAPFNEGRYITASAASTRLNSLSIQSWIDSCFCNHQSLLT